jgi:hypothetical protein
MSSDLRVFPRPIDASRRLGVVARTGTAEQIIMARRDLAAAKIAKAIREALAGSPPLTVEQRESLSLLLGGGQ